MAVVDRVRTRAPSSSRMMQELRYAPMPRSRLATLWVCTPAFWT